MNTQSKTRTLVLGAVLTAMVVVLQFMGSFIRFGPFSISLVLVPIVIGAATCGKGMGAWLGAVFGLVVLISGDAALFLTVSVPGTIATVMVKGIACGFFAGIAHKLFEEKSRYLAVAVAAVICPLFNTGVFLIGCVLFFMETVAGMAQAAGFGADVAKFMFIGLAGGNFLFELAINIILSPAIVRLLNIRNKQ